MANAINSILSNVTDTGGCGIWAELELSAQLILLVALGMNYFIMTGILFDNFLII